MRDLALTLIVFISLPLILYRPWVGIMMWAWIGFMNPHRLAYGFAYDFPWAMIVGIATIVGLIATKDRQPIPRTRETIILAVFILWMTVTSAFSLEPALAWEQWEKVFKIQVMVFVTLMLLNTRLKVDIYIWVIVLSFGFYGTKGGVFTLITGGGYHVMGPAGSFIGGNNEMGLALIMTVPLMRYLQLTASRLIVRWAMLCMIVLSFVAILGTQSRGALVGVVPLGLYLIWNSPKKLTLIALLLIMGPLLYQFMPESWHERMATIETYDQDASVRGRFNSWSFALNLAKDRPLVGGGFECFRARWFNKYAPLPAIVADAHSIYFEVLGEHGFVGLALFLALGLSTFLSAAGLAARGKAEGDTSKLTLARMMQVSLVGYASAGAFLGLAYFDFTYAFVAIVCLMQVLEKRERERDGAAESPLAPNEKAPVNLHGSASSRPTRLSQSNDP